MPKLNENYGKLKASYLFADIAKRVNKFVTDNPDKKVIRLGIGDVTEPLPKACIEAFHKAIDEMGSRETFKGYGDSEGYAFLREAIAKNDFQDHGADIAADEVFVSDGAKCDTANFQELFGTENILAVPDPVYPVYVDTNVMAGRTGENVNDRYEGLYYLDCNAENEYLPALPSKAVDLIYLCFPNNPTGQHISKAELKKWVDFALENNAVILYDAAYVEFISDPEMPRSIFEIEGAKKCAVEFRSFSKNAGFTGTRCAYTIVPKELEVEGKSLHALWTRRQNTKFNGTSYPVQAAAAAVYSDEGKAQIKELISYYMENAKIIRSAMEEAGYKCTGGDNSPYIWINAGVDSWKFFDKLLNDAGVVVTPGAGFGKCGEGHIRISAFNSRENVLEAIERIKAAM